MMGIITMILLWTTCSTPSYNNTLSQQPTYAFRSTSNMMPETHTYAREYASPFSDDVPGAAYAPGHGHIRRGLDDGDEGEGPGYEQGEGGMPIGDTPWVLIALMAAGYGAYTYKRNRNTKQMIALKSDSSK